MRNRYEVEDFRARTAVRITTSRIVDSFYGGFNFITHPFVVLRAEFARTPREVRSYVARSLLVRRAAHDKGTGKRNNDQGRRERSCAWRNLSDRPCVSVHLSCLKEAGPRRLIIASALTNRVFALMRLEIRRFRSTGEGNNVANILHTSHEEYQTFETETEAGVRACTELTSV